LESLAKFVLTKISPLFFRKSIAKKCSTGVACCDVQLLLVVMIDFGFVSDLHLSSSLFSNSMWILIPILTFNRLQKQIKQSSSKESPEFLRI
jgi:hypothetical protein